MISHETRAQLQDIVRGNGLKGKQESCSTIRNLLIAGFGADPTIKSEFENRAILKEKQADFLRSYAERSGLLIPSLPLETEYLTSGGEARIYLAPDWLKVIKVNDAV